MPAFEALGFRVAALSQEDPTLEEALTIVDSLEPRPTFPIGVDLGRQATPRYERTAVYLIDARGIVIETMPMMTHMRASAATILERIERYQQGR